MTLLVPDPEPVVRTRLEHGRPLRIHLLVHSRRAPPDQRPDRDRAELDQQQRA